MDATHSSQLLGTSPFFYYNPDCNADHRQHGHFSPHPSAAAQEDVQIQQQGYQQGIIHGQSQKMFSRRLSTGSAIYLPSSKPQHAEANFPPMASPRPLHQRSSFLGQQESLQLSLDTECGTPDLYLYPSTPPLSISGSSMSSPPSTCSMLPTPVSGPFFTLENMEGVKEGCVGDVKSQILAGGDWSRGCTPPLTPGQFLYYSTIPLELFFAAIAMGNET